MSHTILHLLKHKIDNGKGLRYLNVRLSNVADTVTPLFFGTDLLNNSGVNPSNHCRIHTRYAKVGLATKIMFPPDVTIGGLTHCQNGAWFYSIQGVFQVIFEHQSRNIQLKIVTSLIDTWQGVEADPKLPRKLSVSLQELRTSLLPPEEDAEMNLKPQNERRPVIEATIVVDSTSDYESTNRETLRKSDDKDNEDLNETKFQQFIRDLLRQVENCTECRGEDEKYLTNAVISFLRLICLDTKVKVGNIFSDFLQTITVYCDFMCLNSNTLTSRESTGWEMDDNQNMLLCIVSEWLGKSLNSFKDAIAKKAEIFKEENFSSIDDLPPANILVSRLFPDCMRILVGYWIGLYGSPPPPPSSSQDLPVGKKLDRQDHSYSTSVQTVKIAGGKREDHSYSTSNPTLITTTTTWLETVPISPPQPVPALIAPAPATTRDDHTYVHYENTDADPIIELPKTRKDHTYVSTKEPKVSKPPLQPPVSVVSLSTVTPPYPTVTPPVVCQVPNNNSSVVNEDLGGPPAPKKSKLASSSGKSTLSIIDISHVIDPTKHSFVLLILEFLNNVLISGIGHVVYTRLIQAN